MLKLNNIDKNYYVANLTIEALKDVNLEFRKSEFVAILGPSGCGKTTLLNLVGGLDRYTSGDLIINGRSTKDFEDADWDSYRNHSIGFVFQSYNLIPHLNVLGNVELALTLSGVSIEERKRRAIESLEQVGLHDQIYKKPNQLSGGQMQRVAIARALVNNPDILLADEPTGALDSETSMQIMDILKEIAKDRLIIMVTHNPDIANKYSTRIIRLLDGVVTDDTNPHHTEEVISGPVEAKRIKKARRLKKTEKTSMSFLTALLLSLRNLQTKKARTILTSFAGSIGIIGIALVLALSSGFQNYVDKMQADTLSSYPLTIDRVSADFSSLTHIENTLSEYPEEEKVYINKITDKMKSFLIYNNITDEYVDNAVKTIDPKLINGISYVNGMNLNVFKKTNLMGKDFNVKITTTMSQSQMGMSFSQNIWQELIDNPGFIDTQYDVLGDGRFPTEMNEIAIVVDKYNQISDMMLTALGLMNLLDEDQPIDFNDIIGTEYKLILNDELYKKEDDKFSSNATSISSYQIINDGVYDAGMTLRIVGIIRPNPETSTGSITGAIAYTKTLTDYVLNNSLDSDIVKWQIANPTLNPISGLEYIASGTSIEEQYQSMLTKLGGNLTPISINIYPIDFNAKQAIKKHLDDYNLTLENEEDKVYYTDLMDTLVKSINTTINAISYVLIAFTSISLVVSSIMIGIITYISVLERTKEIGILRSIGARKKDIGRVFNAETLIIGFVAGLFGVLTTVLLTIPINIIINNLVGIKNISHLKMMHAIILVIISMILTLIAGLVPSRLASKKDPVIALRTE